MYGEKYRKSARVQIIWVAHNAEISKMLSECLGGTSHPEALGQLIVYHGLRKQDYDDLNRAVYSQEFKTVCNREVV